MKKNDIQENNRKETDFVGTIVKIFYEISRIFIDVKYFVDFFIDNEGITIKIKTESNLFRLISENIELRMILTKIIKNSIKFKITCKNGLTKEISDINILDNIIKDIIEIEYFIKYSTIDDFKQISYNIKEIFYDLMAEIQFLGALNSKCSYKVSNIETSYTVSYKNGPIDFLREVDLHKKEYSRKIIEISHENELGKVKIAFLAYKSGSKVIFSFINSSIKVSEGEHIEAFKKGILDIFISGKKKYGKDFLKCYAYTAFINISLNQKLILNDDSDTLLNKDVSKLINDTFNVNMDKINEKINDSNS